MKKRILALALAGTTAFSVFGSALSANAAAPTGWPVDSAHTISTNDVYKAYEPVAVSIDTSYTGATQTLKYTEVKDAYVQTHTDEAKVDVTYSFTTNKKDAVKLAGSEDSVVRVDSNDRDKVAVYADNTNHVLYVKNVATDILDTYFKGSSIDVGGTTYTLDKDTVPEGRGYTPLGKADNYPENIPHIAVIKTPQAEATTYKFLTGTDAANVPLGELTELTGKYYYDGKDAKTLYCVDEISSETELLKKAGIAVKKVSASDLYNTTDAKLDIDITSKFDNYALANWTFDGSTSSETTIYPWTVDTRYVVNPDGDVEVKVTEAVSTPTVYLFDFLPFNGTNINSATVATKYNAVVAARTALAADPDNAVLIAAAQKAEADFAATVGNVDWVAETGDGSSYGIRAEVVDEYEDFLSELVLLRRYGDYTVSWTDFKDEYNDQFVSGYYYNPYTGLATNWKWTTDLYNLSELLDDIYHSSVNNAYLNMNTSELMYLMQQYDKYVGYIDKEEVSNDEWGDLLVSILENVAEDDFKKAADYKTFSRKAEDAIDAYNYAETSSMIKTAERRMYDLIISAQTKSTGAADAQDELGATVNSLFFNAKSADKEYLTAGIAASKTNADLTNFAYIAAVTTKNPDSIFDEITLEQTAYTTTGYYSLYPAADYKESGNTAAQFPGNDAHGSKTGNVYNTSYVKDVTDEYEWFLNVYELAAAVNKVSDAKSVNGIVSAVNDALVSAVDNLAVTNAATATANSALDEMIEYYEEELDFYVTGNGVNEDDFNETYYDAYTKALEIADAAEGAYQVAFARRMVAVAGEALTYQGAQTTVTKTMITDLNEAITSGKTALDAIKNSDDYNAAQVTALNKAIAQAQDVVDIYNGKYSSSYNKVNHASVASVGDKDGIVASDITGAIDAIDAAINYSEIVMGWSKNDAGKWMYGTEEGYLNDGWHQVDGGKTWFYFNADGTAKQSEWFQENGTWYWFNSNCGAATGWAKVDGEWYFFKGNNAMKTGWEKVDGNWYYMASSGKMVTGWCEVNGKWYYFSKESNSLGQMLYSTTVDGYKLGADGAWIK